MTSSLALILAIVLALLGRFVVAVYRDARKQAFIRHKMAAGYSGKELADAVRWYEENYE